MHSFLAAPFFSLAFFALSMVVGTPGAFSQTDPTAKENDPLTTYEGKNRVVLVFGPSEDDPDFSKQMAVLQNKPELAERQIIVLPIRGDDKAAGKSLSYLQKKYNKGAASFSMVLIGKDGHDAFQSSEPVSAAAIYEKIDAMPMRQDEIKEKSAETDKTRGESKTDQQKDN